MIVHTLLHMAVSSLDFNLFQSKSGAFPPNHFVNSDIVDAGYVSCRGQTQASLQVHSMPAGHTQDSRGLAPPGQPTPPCTYLSPG